MKNPGATNTGAFAGNLVSGTDLKVKQSPSEINVNICDLVRDYPIIAAHWFGLIAGPHKSPRVADASNGRAA